LSSGYELHGGTNDSITGNIFDLGPGEPGNLPVYGLNQSDSPGQGPVGGFPELVNDVISGNIFASESPAPRNPAFSDLTNGIGNVLVTSNDFWAFTGAPLYVTGGTSAGGDAHPYFVAPASQDATSLAGYASWSGAGINFQAINTSLIGLHPTGPAPY
jgi:hypothetical protein